MNSKFNLIIILRWGLPVWPWRRIESLSRFRTFRRPIFVSIECIWRRQYRYLQLTPKQSAKRLQSVSSARRTFSMTLLTPNRCTNSAGVATWTSYFSLYGLDEDALTAAHLFWSARASVRSRRRLTSRHIDASEFSSEGERETRGYTGFSRKKQRCTWWTKYTCTLQLCHQLEAIWYGQWSLSQPKVFGFCAFMVLHCSLCFGRRRRAFS